MAFQSLYRKYRPQRFGDLVGQEHVTSALRNAVREGRVGHAYLFSGPQRGDIVVFRNPDLGRDNYVKRVIGVPGDQVRVDAGQVIVNGVELDEPYVTQTDDYSFPSNGQPVRVPRNSYFVLGDNRPVSADSHLGWFVRSDQVLGQVWALPVTLAAQR